MTPHELPFAFVEPEPGAPPASIAAELVVHGLLLMRHPAISVGREDRIRRVLAEIAEAERPAIRFPALRVPRWVQATAALLAVAVLVVLFATPERASALSDLRRSTAAMRQGPDRRYEIRCVPPGQVEADAPLGCVVDTRAPGLMVLRHWPPGDIGEVVGGRDAAGWWSIRPDLPGGVIEREDPLADWPPWSMDGREPIVDSLDRLLEALPADFEFSHLPPEARDSVVFDRIRGLRMTVGGPMPGRVELWIEKDTRLVERIEFRWDADDAAHRAVGEKDVRRAAPKHAPIGGRILPPPPPGSKEPIGPPLALIAFQRVASPDLPDDWFTPEGHLRK